MPYVIMHCLTKKENLPPELATRHTQIPASLNEALCAHRIFYCINKSCTFLFLNTYRLYVLCTETTITALPMHQSMKPCTCLGA